MNTRQTEVLPNNTEDKLISLEALRLMSSISTVCSKRVPNLQAVMSGRFTFRHYVDGLSIHGGEVTELEDFSASFEIPAGLSINWVYEGALAFVLNGVRHTVRAEHGKPAAIVIIASQAGIMTREHTAGSELKKLNLLVERDWLARRSYGEPNKYGGLLSADEAICVQHWQPSDDVLRQVSALIERLSNSRSAASLTEEAQVMTLLDQSLRELQREAPQRTVSPTTSVCRASQDFKQQVYGLGSELNSVRGLAEALHISESTLQRRFKSFFGVSASDYLRQRRLEVAKRSMLLEGATIGEAAHRAGYKYPSNFIAAFKVQFGMTPSQLRQSQ